MSSNMQRQQGIEPPVSLDEGYWSALLQEGESARTHISEEEAGGHSVSHLALVQAEGCSKDPEVAAALQADWAAIRQITERDEVIELSVVGYNRGGLLVEWRSLQGFVPASQLMRFPATSNPNVRRSALAENVGQVLQLRVIEIDSEHNRLILSERAANAEPGERADILVRLKPGDVVNGCVTNLCDFGAFIDLGGLEGLVHISELSWGRVSHPSQILQRGQHVDVCVLDVHPETARVALSVKRLRPDPWETVERSYVIGQMVEGEVTNVVDFGAFVCIEEGLEGLIHVSELAEGHFLHPRNVVQEGQVVRARILSIDGKARRLGLTLRCNP